MTAAPSGAATQPAFVHETLPYRGDEEFLAGVVGFVRDGLARDETVVIVEPTPRLAQLREALRGDAGDLQFLDMTDVGANPGRIIAAWSAALDRTTRAGRVLRGVGEPAHPARSATELVECELHEHLLNTAFDGGPAWRLLCPYDVEGLAPSVTARALTTHPFRAGPDGRPLPTGKHTARTPAELLCEALPPPSAEGVLRGEFGAGDVPAVRRTVAQYARSCGLSDDRAAGLELAASELATNSVRHGGGAGTLAMWTEPGAAVVEFSDAGRLIDPLVGRRPPATEEYGGRGVYLVHQLCDLVQVRCTTQGTTVRISTWL
ncbi:anti-sigma factor RsbA family regulatory protein [Geodermatophilus sp. CPCC 205761]|uniref:anti-sigma factor RsbA family regulatory protein n=1 Tax=Geodermatophilus sp. CPCC 205761 TaxID=2936597 RepID=UPI003EE97ECB